MLTTQINFNSGKVTSCGDLETRSSMSLSRRVMMLVHLIRPQMLMLASKIKRVSNAHRNQRQPLTIIDL